MKLEEVRVDLRGRLVPVGQIRHELDSAGYFVPQPHDSLIVTPLGEEFILAPATAIRDSASGFMVAEAVGPAVYLPVSLSAAIRNAMVRRTEAARMVLPGQSGALRSFATPAGEERFLPLSSWNLELAEDNNVLRVTLSAALLATGPAPKQRSSAGSFWPTSDGGPPATLEATFCVNDASRIAAFGALLPGAPFGEASSKISLRRSSGGDFNIGSAPISSAGSMFAFSSQGFVHVIDSGPRRMSVICWQPCPPPQRTGSGFLEGSVRFRSPSVRLTGVSMTQLCDLVALAKSATIELRDGEFGWVQWDSRGEEPFLRIRHAVLQLHLAPGGLEFDYRLSSVEPPAFLPPFMKSAVLSGTFTLPWEALILRYPILAPHRTAFAEACPNSGDDTPRHA